MSSRGPLLASPGLGHLPGAPTGVGSAGPRCLHHVLWAASSSPRAGAASSTAWPPEAPPGVPPAGWAQLSPGRGFRSAGAWAATVGSRGPVFSPAGRALDGPWRPLPDTALARALGQPAFQKSGQADARPVLPCLPRALTLTPTPFFLPLITWTGPSRPGEPCLGTHVLIPASSTLGHLRPGSGLRHRVGLPQSVGHATSKGGEVGLFHPLPGSGRAPVPTSPGTLPLSGCSGGWHFRVRRESAGFSTLLVLLHKARTPPLSLPKQGEWGGTPWALTDLRGGGSSPLAGVGSLPRAVPSASGGQPLKQAGRRSLAGAPQKTEASGDFQAAF
ncbi:uncharacterized protein LOC121023850 [Herpailurus yagouaroundi]|uniref:uncharacterized protein LOC121023850 n=1 Tax=Herpailurus yagouaroundi TaxID=1608482 RepID=UPI001AD6A306|nr:uncharacterized protein LOC121023850 [Puma yagouaroundi]